MDKNKVLGVVFTLLSFGAIQETARIFSSQDADIATNRTFLIVMSVAISVFFIFLAIRFLKKSSKPKGL